jgi:2,3-bisphosphoglycerate-independent phosphoglycerate mutase
VVTSVAYAGDMAAPSKPVNSPFVLIVRDGWGQNPHPEHDAFNAIKLAKTPVAHALMEEYPKTLIHTSGEDVGLPPGTMGNSEVGHQNIGAGRIVPQESLVMTKACEGGLHTNAAVASAIEHAKSSNSSLHLMGINSDAGVHGQLEHLYAVLQACKTLGLSRVYVHLFSDGRDTGPYTGKEFAARVEAKCTDIGVGRVVSVMGRYYAMDRDNRWERVARAYACLTGRGLEAHGVLRSVTVAAAFQGYYDAPSGGSQGGDEFLTPTIIASNDADAAATRVRDRDAVIFYNYRGDRPREISAAFLFPDEKWAKVKPSPDTGKNGFDRGQKLNLHYVTMSAYWEELAPYVKVAFPKPPRMVNIGGQYWSTMGLRQFRCAETEKYPHVTFFFNDYREEPFPGESREIVQSPKVATYDLQPEMSARGVCDAVLRRLAAADCEDVIVVNFANGDMVGHTGSLPAAIKACETVDSCVGEILKATLAKGGSLIVTADHGNAEQMFDPVTNAPHTAHTTYDVPLIVVGAAFKGRKLRNGGRLGDIVPTSIEMMGLVPPPEMTGKSLLS